MDCDPVSFILIGEGIISYFWASTEQAFLKHWLNNIYNDLLNHIPTIKRLSLFVSC